jgi:hypothetical protein
MTEKDKEENTREIRAGIEKVVVIVSGKYSFTDVLGLANGDLNCVDCDKYSTFEVLVRDFDSSSTHQCECGRKYIITLCAKDRYNPTGDLREEIGKHLSGMDPQLDIIYCPKPEEKAEGKKAERLKPVYSLSKKD